MFCVLPPPTTSSSAVGAGLDRSFGGGGSHHSVSSLPSCSVSLGESRPTPLSAVRHVSPPPGNAYLHRAAVAPGSPGRPDFYGAFAGLSAAHAGLVGAPGSSGSPRQSRGPLDLRATSPAARVASPRPWQLPCSTPPIHQSMALTASARAGGSLCSSSHGDHRGWRSPLRGGAAVAASRPPPRVGVSHMVVSSAGHVERAPSCDSSQPRVATPVVTTHDGLGFPGASSPRTPGFQAVILPSRACTGSTTGGSATASTPCFFATSSRTPRVSKAAVRCSSNQPTPSVQHAPPFTLPEEAAATPGASAGASAAAAVALASCGAGTGRARTSLRIPVARLPSSPIVIPPSSTRSIEHGGSGNFPRQTSPGPGRQSRSGSAVGAALQRCQYSASTPGILAKPGFVFGGHSGSDGSCSREQNPGDHRGRRCHCAACPSRGVGFSGGGTSPRAASPLGLRSSLPPPQQQRAASSAATSAGARSHQSGIAMMATPHVFAAPPCGQTASASAAVGRSPRSQGSPRMDRHATESATGTNATTTTQKPTMSRLTLPLWGAGNPASESGRTSLSEATASPMRRPFQGVGLSPARRRKSMTPTSAYADGDHTPGRSNSPISNSPIRFKLRPEMSFFQEGSAMNSWDDAYTTTTPPRSLCGSRRGGTAPPKPAGTAPSMKAGRTNSGVVVATTEEVEGKPAGWMVDAPKAEELGPGVEVEIGGRRFRINNMLGQGSFGAVWGATDLDVAVAPRVLGGVVSGGSSSSTSSGSRRTAIADGEEAAIKEIVCQSSSALKVALQEGELLRRLGEDETADKEARSRIPKLLGVEIQQMQASGGQPGSEWRVLLAMTKVPGTSLVGFLRTYRAEVFDQAAPEDASWDSVLARCAEACYYAHELLVQLAGVMEHISEHTFHRDVHSRNILVEEMQAAPAAEGAHALQQQLRPPCFGLVDFGLAVDACTWRNGLWRHSRVGGDSRYWPASAWVMLERGADELAEMSASRREYEVGLDLHSLGLTAIQVLVAMSAPARSSPKGLAFGAPEGCWQADICLAWHRLWSAWDKYWSDATRFWERVYTAFLTGTSFQDAKHPPLPEGGVRRVVEEHMQTLRVALWHLKEVHERHAAELANHSGVNCMLTPAAVQWLLALLPKLVQAFVKLISGGEVAPSWRSIRHELQTEEIELADPLEGRRPQQPPQRTAQAATSSGRPRANSDGIVLRSTSAQGAAGAPPASARGGGGGGDNNRRAAAGTGAGTATGLVMAAAPDAHVAPNTARQQTKPEWSYGDPRLLALASHLDGWDGAAAAATAAAAELAALRSRRRVLDSRGPPPSGSPTATMSAAAAATPLLQATSEAAKLALPTTSVAKGTAATSPSSSATAPPSSVSSSLTPSPSSSSSSSTAASRASPAGKVGSHGGLHASAQENAANSAAPLPRASTSCTATAGAAQMWRPPPPSSSQALPSQARWRLDGF
eukprot:TRINITY_DN3068_c0_g2_i1.p1 TRINITY_DN3068_c0_g2~~TRINITY_DN3068_c0_g2_i1.p1  ORF type:complete len:1456 (-),score=233.90 TRINITY_DN3068_c0_g2_i1:94-4461(-)